MTVTPLSKTKWSVTADDGTLNELITKADLEAVILVTFSYDKHVAVKAVKLYLSNKPQAEMDYLR